MQSTNLPILVGILMMALAIILLIGWNFLNWDFVDPFFSTLIFFAGPFFVGMGLADPRPVHDRIPFRI